MKLNVNEIRKDFPILERETRAGVRLTYLDSTATSQKPNSVIQAMDDFYRPLQPGSQCRNRTVGRLPRNPDFG